MLLDDVGDGANDHLGSCRTLPGCCASCVTNRLSTSSRAIRGPKQAGLHLVGRQSPLPAA
jgi:hypothetical protein